MHKAIVRLVAVALLAGCASAKQTPPTEITRTQTTTTTLTPPRSTQRVEPTGPIDVGPVTAVEGDCPYISVEDAANMEGNRIDKHYVLVARGEPVGCRFMFWTNAYAVLELTKQTYATADAAYNAMVRIGRQGANYHGVPNLVPGVDGVLYQTTFYPRDGPTDWACTFAKGRTVVTVKTAQNNVGFNARNIAAHVAPKF